MLSGPFVAKGPFLYGRFQFIEHRIHWTVYWKIIVIFTYLSENRIELISSLHEYRYYRYGLLPTYPSYQ